MTANQPSSEPNTSVEQLRGLYQLSKRLNAVYELPELLTFVVDKALNLTGGRRALLLLSDEEERDLQDIALVRGVEPDQDRLEAALAAASSTVIKDVLEQGEPRLVLNLPLDHRYEGRASQETLELKQIRSVLAVPLKVEADLVGLIYIDHPQDGTFDQTDLYFLSAFANQAAAAINRARAHKRKVEALNRLNQRKVEQLTQLNQLSRSVVQVLDLDAVLTNIVNAATEMLQVETGSVLLLDEASDELTFATSVSNGQPATISTRLQRDQGLAGWVLSTGRPVCINEVSKDPRWFGEVENGFATQSLLGVPLQLNQRPLGVIQVLNSQKEGGFNQEDIVLMSAFAASATIAIENARLYQEARQARQLRAFNELALALGRTLDLDTILKIGLGHALSTLKGRRGGIHLLETPAGGSHLPLQINEGLTAEQASALERLTLSRTEEVTFIDPPRPEYAALFDDQSSTLGLAPIKLGSRVQGGLAVVTQCPPAQREEGANLLAGMAHIIGLAVQNALHHLEAQERTRQLIRLNDIGLALTTDVSGLDLPYVLRVIIDGVNATLRTERASIFLIDEKTNELVLHCTNEGDVDIRLQPPWTGSIAGWVATHNQPRMVNDPATDPHYLSRIADEVGYKINSLLCTSIVVEGKVIGVIEALNKKNGRPFQERDQEELIEFSKWAAIAIHNARLFEQRLQAYRRLAEEQQQRRTAETRSAMAAIILDIAHTMNNIIGAIRVWTMDLKEEPVALAHPPFQAGLAEILNNAEEALELIGKIRRPLEKVSLAPTDVHRCLAAAVQNCPWPAQISRREQYAASLPPVRANAGRLESVFQNLLLNAIHALSAQGGQIGLETRYLAPKGLVEIKIIDDGPGIPPAIQERVFDPTVSGKESGLGLGLWLVEAFVHQFDGQVDFTSSAQTGTTFVITLSAWPEANSAPAPDL